jgi:hypothetical protein
VTADHTPERLSAEEREALDAADSILSLLAHRGLIDSDMNREDVRQASDRLARLRPRGGTVADHFDRILAAHLADVEARLAAVEALADRWQRLATIAGSGRVGTTAATAYAQAADELAVTLGTSETLVDGLFADTHRAPDGGRGFPSVTENLGLKPEGALNLPRQDAEVGERVKGDVVVGAESERQEGALGGMTGLGGGVEHESTLVDLGGESQPGLTALSDTIARAARSSSAHSAANATYQRDGGPVVHDRLDPQPDARSTERPPPRPPPTPGKDRDDMSETEVRVEALSPTERLLMVVALGCEFHSRDYGECSSCAARAEQVWDDAVAPIIAKRLAPAPAGDSGGERCANYKPPMTCLTAPSSEAGRCDFCRVEAADFARSPR